MRALTGTLCLDLAYGRGFTSGLRLAGLAARQPVLNWTVAGHAGVPQAAEVAVPCECCWGELSEACTVACSALPARPPTRPDRHLFRMQAPPLASAFAAEPAIRSIVAGQGCRAPAGGHTHSGRRPPEDPHFVLVPAAEAWVAGNWGLAGHPRPACSPAQWSRQGRAYAAPCGTRAHPLGQRL